jgi:hypothetical protein
MLDDDLILISCSLGTPCLAVVLESPCEVTTSGNLSVTTKVTYDGLVGDDGKIGTTDAKPIILHKIGLIEDFRLYRRRHDYYSRNVGKEWEPVLSDETCYRLVKGPDISVHVAKHESFLTLRPGEEAGFIASRSLPSYVPQPQK